MQLRTRFVNVVTSLHKEQALGFVGHLFSWETSSQENTTFSLPAGMLQQNQAVRVEEIVTTGDIHLEKWKHDSDMLLNPFLYPWAFPKWINTGEGSRVNSELTAS